MTANELREKYLKFFEERGHHRLPSAPLIPENDPTVLFTTAGMHPLIPFLMGEKHPAGQRLCDVQKCLRTDDIDEVGDIAHLTFFEMLGNWSLGDYFKKEAIEWSYEFLTSPQWLGLEKEKLAVSCFGGDETAPKDEESAQLWQSVGISKERIAFLGRKANWWGPIGETGPCGPDTEMFYWVGKDPAPKIFNPQDTSWVEIWNDVFMTYNRTKEGKYELLKQKNVDTGMGLERTLAVINHLPSVFETELFAPLIGKIEEISHKKYEDFPKECRIIADHLKASIFLLAEHLEPSNVERGYILRRLIRRAVRFGRLLGIKDFFAFKFVEPVLKIYGEAYPELKENKDFIEEQLVREEEKFSQTLSKGLALFEKLSQNKKIISGKEAFDLYQSYGFPLELIKELAREKNIEVDTNGFQEEFKKHQELSRTASAGMFKGGLASHSDKAIKYHTATHLLHKALQEVLGEEVKQKGSNINEERLRFDFSCSQKPTPEQLKKVEDIVNQKIQENLPVIMKEMSLEEAKKIGAIGLFGEKYGERVKVYFIGRTENGLENAYSKEICGGPHVASTGELGHFKIIKEEAVSQGVRRIKAILE
ncbi:MAG TPA: alanine--tRNA ligase [Candidatus Paceibacterota bacterium]|nr:alanine--tRNA ligase [Candidatus Paceibacterota bacterium]HPP16779.1 alanine--tRNA ligase [Candidatus Paceibacterota bacterium]HRU33510.1 alanine--tRNA ligase [Candidatus Paceibacterota bacterium]